MTWNVTTKKNPCPACCPKHGNAWFDLIFNGGDFYWRCRNCGEDVPAEGIEPHDDADLTGSGVVDGYLLDTDGRINYGD